MDLDACEDIEHRDSNMTKAATGLHTAALGNRLSDAEYVLQRSRPGYSNVDYLQLKDLHDILAAMSSEFAGDVFDYGCGGAPYRQFFASCKSYVKADITPGRMVDRLLAADGLTTEAPESYDLVISSQVLEHVKDPELYLRECHRILQPGGQVVVTTHGMMHEHGCPADFQRWTSRGLEELLTRTGFQVLDSLKLTTQIRAAIQLAHHCVPQLRAPDNLFLHYLFAVFRKGYHWFLVPVLNWVADRFAGQATAPGSSTVSHYTGVCARARKI